MVDLKKFKNKENAHVNTNDLLQMMLMQAISIEEMYNLALFLEYTMGNKNVYKMHLINIKFLWR